MSTTAPAPSLGTPVPGYVAGRWSIDPVHSEVAFTVRHMMVSKVRGRFGDVSGTLVTATDPLESSVTARIDVSSVHTGSIQRDEHIRSADFLDVGQFPEMTYRSTGIRPAGTTSLASYVVDGELSLHGVTRAVALALELNGVTPDPYGGTRAGFSATTTISRKDFGVDIALPMDGGGVVVGDAVSITLEIQAVLETPDA